MEERKVVMAGNRVRNSYFSSSGKALVIVTLSDVGEDEIVCYVENGILYEYVNGVLILCTNDFRLEFVDKTKKK